MNYSVCPTITAYNDADYKSQLELITSFAPRIHIDYMDGQLAPTVSQTVHESWWPKRTKVDLHLMYKYPMKVLSDVLDHHPNLVIVHSEADHVSSFIHELHEHRTKVGIVVSHDTSLEALHHYINVIDHVLIFSGNLGHHGGTADLALLDKVIAVKKMRPEIEIGWDGGINNSNIIAMKEAGVSIFNVGNYIHGSENPQTAYQHLLELIQ